MSDETGAVDELEAIGGRKEGVGKLRRFSFNQGWMTHWPGRAVAPASDLWPIKSRGMTTFENCPQASCSHNPLSTIQ